MSKNSEGQKLADSEFHAHYKFKEYLCEASAVKKKDKKIDNVLTKPPGVTTNGATSGATASKFDTAGVILLPVLV